MEQKSYGRRNARARKPTSKLAREHVTAGADAALTALICLARRALHAFIAIQRTDQPYRAQAADTDLTGAT